MSERQSYQSRMADRKLKRFASHWQSTHGQAANSDDPDPHGRDDSSVNSGQSEHTRSPQHSPMSIFKDLRVGQAGIIWGSDGTLLGKVQDDSLANPEELEGYPLNEKGEVLDEDGEKIGQALFHDTLVGTRFRNARDHSFYKMKPDENERYHCPYTALGLCWYRPQKLKSNFESVTSGHLPTSKC